MGQGHGICNVVIYVSNCTYPLAVFKASRSHLRPYGVMVSVRALNVDIICTSQA